MFGGERKVLLGQIFTTIGLALVLIATYFILNYKKIEIPSLVYKIASGVLALVFFFRYLRGPDALE